ncbi:MAG: hypothetical protein AB1505_34040 [Candidatus Latescibacterota bacterium]
MDRVMRTIATLGMLVPAGMLRTFVTSSTGQVLPECAVGLGWVAAACASLAVIMASAQRAEAYLPCDILDPGQCQYWGCYSNPYCGGAGSRHYWRREANGPCHDMCAESGYTQYCECYVPPGGC